MQRNRGKRIWLLMVTFGIMAAASGCGSRENVDYGDNGSEDASVCVDGVLREELGAGEAWEERLLFDQGNPTEIHASVTVPEVEDMRTIQTREKHFDSEDKKEILTKLSDGTVYKYEIGFRTKKDLEWEIERLEWKIEYDEGVAEAFGSDYEDEEYLDETYQELAELKELYEKASDDYVPADDFQGDLYLITQNDVYFIAGFDSSGMSIVPKDEKDVVADSSDSLFAIGVETLEAGWENNECDISQDEACEMALDYAKRLTGDSFIPVHIYPLVKYYDEYMPDDKKYGYTYVYDGSEEKRYDGYVISLWRSIDGVKVDGGDEYWNSRIYLPQVYEEVLPDGTAFSGEPVAGYEKESANHSYESMEIYVNDSGVIQMYYASPYELTEEVVGNVTLLSFDKIQECIREELAAKYYYHQGAVKFRYLELMYYPLRNEDSEGEYTIVPVWVLKDGDSEGNMDVYVVVNAIDGSIINIGRQDYNLVKSYLQ